MRHASHLDVGRRGELLAWDHLAGLGYELIERNYRTRSGEIDLIAGDHATLVFCEVKTLVSRPELGLGPRSPLESIRRGKRAQVRRLARQWLASREGGARGYAEIRFDAIGVLLDRSGEPVELEHLEAAF